MTLVSLPLSSPLPSLPGHPGPFKPIPDEVISDIFFMAGNTHVFSTCKDFTRFKKIFISDYLSAYREVPFLRPIVIQQQGSLDQIFFRAQAVLSRTPLVQLGRGDELSDGTYIEGIAGIAHHQLAAVVEDWSLICFFQALKYTVPFVAEFFDEDTVSKTNEILKKGTKIPLMRCISELAARLRKHLEIHKESAQVIETIKINNKASKVEVPFLPAEIACFSHVREIELTGLRLRFIPDKIASLLDLVKLDLSDNKLRELPDLSALSKLRHVDLTDNHFTEIPAAAIGTLDVQYLYMRSNNIIDLNMPYGTFKSLTHLNVADNDLTIVPDLSHLPLLCVDLCKNKIIHMEKLNPALVGLDVSQNNLYRLPSVAACPDLQLLAAHQNDLWFFPEEIAQCTDLRWCSFDRNPLRTLRTFPNAVLSALPHLVHLGLSPEKLALIPSGTRDALASRGVTFETPLDGLEGSGGVHGALVRSPSPPLGATILSLALEASSS